MVRSPRSLLSVAGHLYVRSRKLLRPFALAALLASPCVPAAAEVVALPGGAAEIDMPASYAARVDGVALMLVSRAGLAMRVRAVAMARRESGQLDVAEVHVRRHAAQEGLPLFVVQGGGIGCLRQTSKGQPDSNWSQETLGLYAVGNMYVIFDIRMDDEIARSPAGKEFMESGFKVLLARLRSRGT